MGELFELHPETPETWKINRIVNYINDGAVVLYPTDTGFTLGCELGNKEAITRIRRLRNLPDKQSLTFLCDSVSHISEFAKVSNKAYKTIKRLIPGPYTFILPASKQVPKLAQNPKRKTSGIRVPNNNLAQILLKELEMPLISISAKLPDEDDDFPSHHEDIIDFFAKQVDIAVTSSEYNFLGESTVIDMTTDEFEILREGAGIENVLEII